MFKSLIKTAKQAIEARKAKRMLKNLSESLKYYAEKVTSVHKKEGNEGLQRFLHQFLETQDAATLQKLNKIFGGMKDISKHLEVIAVNLEKVCQKKIVTKAAEDIIATPDQKS